MGNNIGAIASELKKKEALLDDIKVDSNDEPELFYFGIRKSTQDRIREKAEELGYPQTLNFDDGSRI